MEVGGVVFWLVLGWSLVGRCIDNGPVLSCQVHLKALAFFCFWGMGGRKINT